MKVFKMIALISIILTVWFVLVFFVLYIIICDDNIDCKGQSFYTASEFLETMEEKAMAISEYDTSLDYCPPYELVYQFDYDDNTIIFYTYSESFGEDNLTDCYAVRVLKHNPNGTMSFDGGFADFLLHEPDSCNSYYYFTNIDTYEGEKSISFLYLPENSQDKNIIVDGVTAKKIPVTINNKSFYICYAISHRDTLLSNLFTPIESRHTVSIEG